MNYHSIQNLLLRVRLYVRALYLLKIICYSLFSGATLMRLFFKHFAYLYTAGMGITPRSQCSIFPFSFFVSINLPLSSHAIASIIRQIIINWSIVSDMDNLNACYCFLAKFMKYHKHYETEIESGKT